MPYSDELGRQYTVDEARFWREVQHVSKTTPGNVRIVPIAEEFGIHPQRARQHVRTWANDGLVRNVGQNANIVTLTPFGRRFTFEERYRDIE